MLYPNFFLLFITFLMGCLLASVIHIYPVAASSDSFIRNDINRLNARVSRLENQIGHLNQGQARINTSPRDPSVRNTPQIVDGELVGRSDGLFERLSTLVIELKERVMELETRMTQVEKKK